MVFGDIGEREEKIFAESARALWSGIDERTLTFLWFTLGNYYSYNKVYNNYKGWFIIRR